MWRIYGGYSFSSILGIEAGYTNNPENKYSSGNEKITVNNYTVDLLGKATLPLNNLGKFFSKLSVYGKAGIAYSKTNTDININNFQDKKSKSAIVPVAGIGIIFNLTNSLALDLSFNGFFGRDHVDNANEIATKNPVPSCGLLAIGLSYKFTGIL